MADPDTDHGFVYTEDGYVDILASPFFDVRLGLDTTVNGYIERIRYTLVGSLEVHLGVFPRFGPADDDFPLHPSYVALQTLYKQQPTPGPSTSFTTVPDSHSPAPAEVLTVHSPGGSFQHWYWLHFCLAVALGIICRSVLLVA